MRPVLAEYLAVGLGSLLGGVARWLLSLWIDGGASSVLPLGTLFVNCSGSLLIGCYAALAVPGGPLASGALPRLFMTVGFCGGYTTFSIFSLETLTLVHAGMAGHAALNVGLSVLLWFVAAWAGYRAARLLRNSVSSGIS